MAEKGNTKVAMEIKKSPIITLSKSQKKFVIDHKKENGGTYDFEGMITIDSYISLTGKKWFVCVATFNNWEDGYVEDSIKKCIDKVVKDVKRE